MATFTTSHTLHGIPLTIKHNTDLPCKKNTSRDIQVEIYTADGIYLYQHLTSVRNILGVMEDAKNVWNPETSWLVPEIGTWTKLVAKVVGYVNGDNANARDKFRAKSNAVWHKNAKAVR